MTFTEVNDEDLNLLARMFKRYDPEVLIDGQHVCSLSQFIADNQFEPEEAEELVRDLREHGVSHGGGGAFATFVVQEVRS